MMIFSSDLVNNILKFMAHQFNVNIPAGETKDISFYVNITGYLNIAIRTRDGSNYLPASWWIIWGLGAVSQIGPQSQTFRTEIPVKWWKGAVSAKLRASAGMTDTVLTIYENSQIDGTISFHW